MHVPRVKASHQVTVVFGCGQQPGERWAPPGYLALDTLRDEDNQKHHTGSAVARVTKGRAFRCASGRRCKVCYWRTNQPTAFQTQHLHWHMERENAEEGRKGGTHTGTDGAFLDCAKYDGRTLEKRQRRKATSCTSVDVRTNTCMALGSLFTRISRTL